MTENTPNKTVSIIVDAQSTDDDNTKGFFGGGQPERREISVESLRKSLNEEAQKLLDILTDLPARDGWGIKEVEVGLDISAEGGVSFIGTAKVTSKASLKLKFSR